MQSTRSIYLCILFFSFQLTFAQNREISEANQKFKDYAYIDARKIYLRVAEGGYKTPEILQKLGDSYYFNGELENAVEWYAELVTKYSDFDAEYLFRYAQSLRGLELYKEADKILKKYYYEKGIDPNIRFSPDDQRYLELIDLESGKFELLDFEYNSKYSDFSPQFYEEGKLLFSSSRDTISYPYYDWNNQPFLELYTTNDGKLEKFEEGINSKFHEASAIATKSGDTLYFSRNNYVNPKKGKNKDGTMLLKLYRAIRKNGKWESIKELPFNSNQYSVAHPALSTDGKQLYFASDMPGGFGKLDLYVVDILDHNKYSAPKNLGANINTVSTETFPFIAKDGKLYFSSDGHFGLGGLDVFAVPLNKLDTNEPYNLARPVNSVNDDFSFIINSDTSEGYFASNRAGGLGDDDIYKYIQKEKLLIECIQYVKGTIRDYQSYTTISHAAVHVYNQQYELLNTVLSDSNGNFELALECSNTYVIKIKQDDYQMREEVLAIDNTFEKENKMDVVLKKAIKLSLSLAIAGDDLNEILGLSKIHFDYNKATLKSSSKIELHKVIEALKSNPKLRLNIKSYTDHRGRSEYNRILSSKRSLSAKEYITTVGKIHPSRIVTQGLGESNPIANCGKNCSEYELEQNRRSEFIIID